MFALTASVDNPDAVTGHILRGQYTSHADIVGVQLTWDVGWPPL